MSDLTDEELSELARNAERLPSSPITLREIEPLLDEIGRRRAAQTVREREARIHAQEQLAVASGWVDLGDDVPSPPGEPVSAELRHRRPRRRATDRAGGWNSRLGFTWLRDLR